MAKLTAVWLALYSLSMLALAPPVAKRFPSSGAAGNEDERHARVFPVSGLDRMAGCGSRDPDGRSRHGLGTGRSSLLSLPEWLHSVIFAENRAFLAKGFRFEYRSFVTPPRINEATPGTGKLALTHVTVIGRKNTFTDFIAIAEALVMRKYTMPSRLAIQGLSAGGLLMAAMICGPISSESSPSTFPSSTCSTRSSILTGRGYRLSGIPGKKP